MWIDFSGDGSTGPAGSKPEINDCQERYPGTEVIRGDIAETMEWFFRSSSGYEAFDIMTMRNLVLEDLRKIGLILLDPGHAQPFMENRLAIMAYADVAENDRQRMRQEIDDLAIDIAVFVGDIFICEKMWIAEERDPDDYGAAGVMLRNSSLFRNFDHHRLFCDPTHNAMSASRELQDIWASKSFASNEYLYRDPG